MKHVNQKRVINQIDYAVGLCDEIDNTLDMILKLRHFGHFHIDPENGKERLFFFTDKVDDDLANLRTIIGRIALSGVNMAPYILTVDAYTELRKNYFYSDLDSVHAQEMTLDRMVDETNSVRMKIRKLIDRLDQLKQDFQQEYHV